MTDDEKRKLVEDVYKEKREWCSRSVRRMFDAGMTIDEISQIVGLTRSGIKYICHFEHDIDWDEMR